MNKSYLFQEIIIKNPVLVGTIGICPVVAICTSLKAAIIMSVITILTLVVAQALSSLIFSHFSQWLRMGLYMLVGMAVVIPSILILDLISPEMMLAMGIYLPLLSVNPIIVRQCEREGVNIGLKESFINSLCAGLGYSLVLIIVGFIRELFGNGSLWGFSIPFMQPIPSLLTPMGGFVIIGFLTATLHAYFKKIDPAYAEELAVNSRTAIKKGRNVKSLLIDVEESSATAETPAPKRKRRAKDAQVEESPVEPVVEAAPQTPSIQIVDVIQGTPEVSAEEEIEKIATEIKSEEKAPKKKSTKKAKPAKEEVEVIEEVGEAENASAPVEVEEAPVEAPAEKSIEVEKPAEPEEVPQFAELSKDGPVPQFAEPIKDASAPVFAEPIKEETVPQFAEPVKETPAPKKATRTTRSKAKAEEPAPKKAEPQKDSTTATKKEKKFEFITLELPSAAAKAEAEVIPSGPVATEETAVKKPAASNRNIVPKEKKETAKKPAKSQGTTKKETAAKADKKADVSEKKAPAKSSSKTSTKTSDKANAKKSGSSIIYKSDELEKLMSMSLDDILNDLPDATEKEEGESK